MQFTVYALKKVYSSELSAYISIFHHAGNNTLIQPSYIHTNPQDKSLIRLRCFSRHESTIAEIQFANVDEKGQKGAM